MIIKKEDVKAIKADDEIVCAKCVKDDDYDGITLEDVLTEETFENEHDEDLVFCDRCSERIE